jgi:hypothetical protein
MALIHCEFFIGLCSAAVFLSVCGNSEQELVRTTPIPEYDHVKPLATKTDSGHVNNQIPVIRTK